MDTIRRERVSGVVRFPRFIESLRREVERQRSAGRSNISERVFALAERHHFFSARWWLFRRIHSRRAGNSGLHLWSAVLPEASCRVQFVESPGFISPGIAGYGDTETTFPQISRTILPLRGRAPSQVFPCMEVPSLMNSLVLNVACARENVFATSAVTSRMVADIVGSLNPDGWFRTGHPTGRGADEYWPPVLSKMPAGKTSRSLAGWHEFYLRSGKISAIAKPAFRDLCVFESASERDGNAEFLARYLAERFRSTTRPLYRAPNRSLAEYHEIRHSFFFGQKQIPHNAAPTPMLPRIPIWSQKLLSAYTENTPAAIPCRN